MAFDKKKYIPMLEQATSLLVVFLMIAAAALWTGSLFGNKIGQDAKSANKAVSVSEQPDAEILAKLGLDKNVQLTVRDSASWNVENSQRVSAGTIISTAPYAKEVKGFAGPTPLYIYVSADGIVKKIAAAPNAETPDFFDRAQQGILPAFEGINASDATNKEVDAVSGATFSSKALVANIQQSLSAQSNAQGQIAQYPTIGITKTLATILVLLLGVIASMKFKGNARIRIAQLVLNVLVLGFWCGQFLSLSLLRGWTANGVDIIAYLPTLLVLLVAIIMPFFHHKQHYCVWVCPLGSLQELAGRLPFPKIKCSAKTAKIMSTIRIVVFSLLMLTLWTGLSVSILDYEPFTAFYISNASPVVLAMAVIILLASCFVPRFWCRCLCPMGTTLRLSESSN